MKNDTEGSTTYEATVKEKWAGSGRRGRLDNVEKTVCLCSCSQLTCGKLPGTVLILDLSLFGLQKWKLKPKLQSSWVSGLAMVSAPLFQRWQQLEDNGWFFLPLALWAPSLHLRCSCPSRLVTLRLMHKAYTQCHSKQWQQYNHSYLQDRDFLSTAASRSSKLCMSRVHEGSGCWLISVSISVWSFAKLPQKWHHQHRRWYFSVWVL